MKDLIKFFQQLVTSGDLHHAFTNLIREADIYWEKPIGTAKEFQKAFNSPKTNDAVKYVMAIAGLIGDESAVRRTAATLKKRHLHFKVSPQYIRKGGKMHLSHFEVKGFDIGGKGEVLKINQVAKRLMMGTPIPRQKALIAVRAILPRGRRKPIPNFARHQLAYAKLQAKVMKSIIKRRKHWWVEHEARRKIRWMALVNPTFARKYLDDRVWKAATLSDYNVFKELAREVVAPMLSDIGEEGHYDTDTEFTGKSLDQFDEGDLEDFGLLRGDLFDDSTFERTVYKRVKCLVTKRCPNCKRWYKEPTTRKLAEVDRKVPVRRKPRSLNPSERARVLKAQIEMLRCTQQIVWVLHSTIKLNDRRHKYWYVEEGFVPQYEEEDKTINLYGFVDHSAWYYYELCQFDEWFRFFAVEVYSDKLKHLLLEAAALARRLEGRTFPTPDEAQDEIDKLIERCIPALKAAGELQDVLLNSSSVFDTKVLKGVYEVPKTVYKHKRHETQKKIDIYVRPDEIKWRRYKYFGRIDWAPLRKKDPWDNLRPEFKKRYWEARRERSRKEYLEKTKNIRGWYRISTWRYD